MTIFTRYRGQCGECGMQRMVRRDGTIGAHNAPLRGVIVAGNPCQGEGTTPIVGSSFPTVTIVRGPVPRGVCPVCDKSVACRADGTARVHARFVRGHRMGPCLGVGRPTR